MQASCQIYHNYGKQIFVYHNRLKNQMPVDCKANLWLWFVSIDFGRGKEYIDNFQTKKELLEHLRTEKKIYIYN